MSNREIKPCPFCGGAAKIKLIEAFANTGIAGFRFTIVCSKCGVEFPVKFNVGFYLTDRGEIKQGIGYEDAIETAINFWNRRAENERSTF